MTGRKGAPRKAAERGARGAAAEKFNRLSDYFITGASGTRVTRPFRNIKQPEPRRKNFQAAGKDRARQAKLNPIPAGSAFRLSFPPFFLCAVRGLISCFVKIIAVDERARQRNRARCTDSARQDRANAGGRERRETMGKTGRKCGMKLPARARTFVPAKIEFGKLAPHAKLLCLCPSITGHFYSR